jgi:hypothetical protein
MLASCSSPTANKTGSVSGNISLVNDTGITANDPVDFGGVTIAFYHAAALDTTIVRLNAAYPEVGIQIDQQTEFDHRLLNPVKKIITSADGSFNLTKIPVGTYNLVVLKEGWGVRYFYDLKIAKGKHTLGGLLQAEAKTDKSYRSDIDLYPARTLSGYIVSGYNFQSNHSYIVSDNVSILGNINISASANIWIAPNESVSILEGMVSTPALDDNYARITTSYGMYNTTITPIEVGQYFYNIDCAVVVTFAQNRLCRIMVSNSLSGLNVKTSNLAISYLNLRRSKNGLSCSQANTLTISNCLVTNTSDPEQGGVTLTSCTNTETSKLILMGCNVGIRQHDCSNANISNCYFFDNTSRDIYNLFETRGNVNHCDFALSNTAIETSGASNTNIQYCNIQGINGIYNSQQQNWQSSRFQANYNNILCTGYAMKTKARFFTGGIIDFNCENNYWYDGTQAGISALIWDRNDENPNGSEYNEFLGIIDYQPYKTSRVQNAGIESGI